MFVCLFVRDGCRFLQTKPDLIASLFALTSDPSVAIVKDCFHVLINLSADETLHQVSPAGTEHAVLDELTPDQEFRGLVQIVCAGVLSSDLCSFIYLFIFVSQVLVAEVKVLPVLLKNLVDPDYLFSDQISTILSNLTRHEKTCRTVFKVFLMILFTITQRQKKKQTIELNASLVLTTKVFVLVLKHRHCLGFLQTRLVFICPPSGPAGGCGFGQAGGDLLQRELQPEGQTELPGSSAVQPDPAPRGQNLHDGPGQVTGSTQKDKNSSPVNIQKWCRTAGFMFRVEIN